MSGHDNRSIGQTIRTLTVRTVLIFTLAAVGLVAAALWALLRL